MAALEYLDQASILGRSTVALFLILGLNWAFSALHSYQEWRGEEVPLWRVFFRRRGWTLVSELDWVVFLHYHADAHPMGVGFGGRDWVVAFQRTATSVGSNRGAGRNSRRSAVRQRRLPLDFVRARLPSKSGHQIHAVIYCGSHFHFGGILEGLFALPDRGMLWRDAGCARFYFGASDLDGHPGYRVVSAPHALGSMAAHSSLGPGLV